MTWDILLQVFLAALFGGLFTLAGGYFQQKRADKNRVQQSKRELKFRVLYDFNANKNAIGVRPDTKDIFRAEFLRSLNSIPIAFHDSRKVVDSYEKFTRAIHNRSSVSSNELDELLYQLIVSMYEELDIVPPNYHTHSTFLDVE